MILSYDLILLLRSVHTTCSILSVIQLLLSIRSMIPYRSLNLSFHVCNVLNPNRVWFEALKMISSACQSISECPKLPCQSIDVSMLKFHNSSPPFLAPQPKSIQTHCFIFSCHSASTRCNYLLFSSAAQTPTFLLIQFVVVVDEETARERAKPEGRPIRQTSTGSFPNDVQDSEWIWRLFISCFCTSVHCFRFSSCRFNTLYSLFVVTKSWNSVTGKNTSFSRAMSCRKKVTNTLQAYCDQWGPGWSYSNAI